MLLGNPEDTVVGEDGDRGQDSRQGGGIDVEAVAQSHRSEPADRLSAAAEPGLSQDFREADQ